MFSFGKTIASKCPYCWHASMITTCLGPLCWGLGDVSLSLLFVSSESSSVPLLGIITTLSSLVSMAWQVICATWDLVARFPRINPIQSHCKICLCLARASPHLRAWPGEGCEMGGSQSRVSQSLAFNLSSLPHADTSRLLWDKQCGKAQCPLKATIATRVTAEKHNSLPSRLVQLSVLSV